MPLNSSLGLYPCGPCKRATKSIIAKKFIKIKEVAGFYCLYQNIGISHSAGLQHYSDSPWDRLKREKIFAQWPLKSYLPEMEKLQKLTRDYWQAREKAGSTLGTTKLVLGVKPAEGMAVKYEGMTARRITAGNIEAETKAFTNLTNELEEMRKKPAVITAHKTNTTPSAVRYWKVKDSSVNIRGLEDKLDTLFSLFVKYLGKEVEPGYFTVTDGQRPMDNQLYHVLGDYLAKGPLKSLYRKFITNAGNEDIFKKIDTNKYPYLTDGSANSLSNPAVQELKKQLAQKYSGEDKLLQAMQNTNLPFPHVRSNAADLSINVTNDPHQYSLRMNEENFKKIVKEAVVIKIHSAGYGAPHIHLSFR